MRAPLATAFLGLLLLAAPPPARADSDGERAAALLAQYKELYPDTGWGATDRRVDIARKLGKIPGAVSREALLTILKSGRTLDEKLLAVLSLGQIADFAAAEELVDRVEKEDHPALWVALTEGIAATKDDGVKRWVGGTGLSGAKGRAVRSLALAAAALGRTDAVPKLADLWVENRGKRAEIDLGYDLVLALGRLGGPEAREVLLDASAHDDWRIRLAAADSLPRLLDDRDEPVVGAMRTLLEDVSPTVRRIAARCAGEMKLEALVPWIIERLKDQRLAVRHEAYLALVAITGVKLGHDPDAWVKWWKDREVNEGKTVTVAEYYGFGIYSDRVLFLVDTSGSMSWPWRVEPKRIEVARRELGRVLADLSEDTLFNVIAFSDRVRAWQSRKEVDATKANVEKAVRWIEKSFEADGETWTWAALKEAFEKNAEFDTIYLLSDGMPSDGDLVSPEGLVCQVREWNRYRRATVNTIGLTLERLDLGRPNRNEDLPAMKQFLKTLAAATGGESRIVTNVPRR